MNPNITAPCEKQKAVVIMKCRLYANHIRLTVKEIKERGKRKGERWRREAGRGEEKGREVRLGKRKRRG